MSWRREWQPIPVSLPGESHGQRNLVGYSPGGRKVLHMTKHAVHMQKSQRVAKVIKMMILKFKTLKINPK